jgi:hypothetical protein
VYDVALARPIALVESLRVGLVGIVDWIFASVVDRCIPLVHAAEAWSLLGRLVNYKR